MSLDESLTLNDILRWKVPLLKDFLRDRGLKTSGTKSELAALVYAAHELAIPKKPNVSEEKEIKKEEYNSLLKVGDMQLPDPFAMENGWLGEDKDICKWPPVFQVHIAEFLLTGEQVKTDMSKRLLSDYKEGKAYSYFTSKWLKEVFYHEISSSSIYCFLKSETTPSQSINNPTHKIWVCVEKNTGNVTSAYCTCFAGLGSTCNHIAAVLVFKVEHAWKTGLVIVKSPTDSECVWKSFWTKKKQKLEPQRRSEIQIRKPQFKKKTNAINCSEKLNYHPVSCDSPTKKTSLKLLMSTMFPTLPNAYGFNYVNLGLNEPNYSPEDNVNIGKNVEVETSPTIPESLIEMLYSVNKEEELLTKLSNIGPDEVAILENHTRGQNSNDKWKHQRFGRITASVCHRVMTKVLSLKTSTKPVSYTSLLNSLCPSEAEKNNRSPANAYWP